VLSAARSTPRELLLCALLHQKLARIEHLWPATLALALDERAPPSVRAPALEALAGSRRFVDASALIDALHAPREVLRRSAALALGEVRDDRTTQALIDLLERENDPLTRGFASRSLGRQAQPAGVEVLLAQRLTAGDAQQPWTWLGLGVAARAGIARARAGLLTQARPRARADEQAAQFLAIGLARQVGAFAVLDRGSSTLTSALVRPFAAEGLGLLATTPACALLRERIATEQDPVSLAMLGLSLSRLGVSANAPALLDVWRRCRQPGARRLAMRCLAAHGSVPALRALLEIAATPSFDAGQRGAALEGASAVLTLRPLGRLSPIGRNANFLLFEDWMLEIVCAEL
jgi:HEAT repeat protein